MAKVIGQFRWYGEGSSKNYPPQASLKQYKTGSVFKNHYPIKQLGIQCLPGTKFYLNGSVNSIVIGASGIYDLDMKNGASITSLTFDEESLKRVDANNYLIVDMLYGEED